MKTTNNKQILKLLHAMAAEIEQGFSSFGVGDWCIEIPAADARRLLARYERLRKKMALAARQKGAQ